jgi:hypothetical protein
VSTITSALRSLRCHPFIAAVVLGVVAGVTLLLVSIERAPLPPAGAGAPGEEGAFTAPLTGLRSDDPEVLERPVVAVKVENSEAARPQSGLDEADIVFEEIVEGGITRFLALFQSQVPSWVGPVRSARPEDAQVFPAFDGVLFHSGARPEVLTGLTRAGVVWRSDDAGSPVFSRTDQRPSPHNLYARGPDLFHTAGLVAEPADPVGWPFEVEAPPGAVPCPEPCASDPGSRISIAMSDVARTGFTYDPAGGVYNRQQNGTPHRVTGDGEVAAANVVVLGMAIGDGGCCDSSGARYTATEVMGSGPMVLLRDGQRYTGRWEKASPGGQFRLLDRSGSPLALRPGPTWILMAPLGALPE